MRPSTSCWDMLDDAAYHLRPDIGSAGVTFCVRMGKRGAGRMAAMRGEDRERRAAHRAPWTSGRIILGDWNTDCKVAWKGEIDSMSARAGRDTLLKDETSSVVGNASPSHVVAILLLHRKPLLPSHTYQLRHAVMLLQISLTSQLRHSKAPILFLIKSCRIPQQVRSP